MNKRRYQILRTRIKPLARESRQSLDWATFLFKSIPFRVSLGILGAILVSLFAFYALTTKKSAPKNLVNTPVPAATGSGSPVILLPESDAAMLAQTENAHPESSVTAEPAMAKNPAPNLSTPSKAPVGSGETQSPPNTAKEGTEAKRSTVERKNVEKQRLHAERKRSRLEAMYQKHLISSEAYKSGQEEYKNEIEKYRLELNGSGSVSQ
jgi:hypothetical protein